MLNACTSIGDWLRDNPKATAAECAAEMVKRIETELQSTSEPSEQVKQRARAAAEQCESLITCLLSNDEKEPTRRKFNAIIVRAFTTDVEQGG